MALLLCVSQSYLEICTILIRKSTQRCLGGGLGQRAGGDVEHLDLSRLLRAGEVRARRLGGASQQEGARALGDQPALGRVGEYQR